MRRSLRRTFSPPERPTLTSRSLQSITQPFQKRFREVFGNARILIFYLSIKAWEEKSLPKSYLGWFFLVFGEVKATKENMSIFWFIWPLSYFWNRCFYTKDALSVWTNLAKHFVVCLLKCVFSIRTGARCIMLPDELPIIVLHSRCISKYISSRCIIFAAHNGWDWFLVHTCYVRVSLGANLLKIGG